MEPFLFPSNNSTDLRVHPQIVYILKSLRKKVWHVLTILFFPPLNVPSTISSRDHKLFCYLSLKYGVYVYMKSSYRKYQAPQGITK